MTNKLLFLLITMFSFFGCATTPAIDPNDIAPAPEMAKELDAELSKVISSSHCRILGCVNLKSNPNSYICSGEFSFIVASTAQKKFLTAASKVATSNFKIDFTADESFGSKMLAAFIGGAAGGLASVGAGQGTSFYYGGTSSAPIKFTVLPVSEIERTGQL